MTSNPAHLMHRSDLMFAGGEEPYQPRFRALMRLPVAGRTWTLAFASRPEFERASGHKFVPVVAVAGLLLSGILFLLTRAQASALHERKRAAAERQRLLALEQEARREAERASHLKDEFLATVSHELRTPLNAILGWAQLLQGGRLDPETTQQAVEAVVRNAKAQSHLIEDLLDVSRIITGKLRLHVRRVELAEVIEAALETVGPAAQAKQIQMQSHLDAEESTISGDPHRLQQIIWNLLSNSIKFTPQGGCVEVHLRQVDSQAEIVVRDTGRGISPEFLPHVFFPFRQADGSTTRKHGGLGLGLAIVRHLVELHVGTVGAHSAGEGQGATFTIRLPVQAVLESPVAPGPVEKEETEAASGAPASLKGMRVLIVDDEADARAVLQRALQQAGAEVTMAASAAEAMAAVRTAEFDVLISDIGMPEMDGYGLIEQVRSLPQEESRCIPAIALTAFSRAEDRQRAMQAGFDLHAVKPVDAAELTVLVAGLARGMKSDDRATPVVPGK